MTVTRHQQKSTHVPTSLLLSASPPRMRGQSLVPCACCQAATLHRCIAATPQHHSTATPQHHSTPVTLIAGGYRKQVLRLHCMLIDELRRNRHTDSRGFQGHGITGSTPHGRQSHLMQGRPAALPSVSVQLCRPPWRLESRVPHLATDHRPPLDSLRGPTWLISEIRNS